MTKKNTAVALALVCGIFFQTIGAFSGEPVATGEAGEIEEIEEGIPPGSALNELVAPADRQKVLAGGTVAIDKDMGKAWPQVTIYQLIQSSSLSSDAPTPEESTAVFYNFESQPIFLSDTVKKVQILEGKGTANLLVSYSLQIYINWLIGTIKEEYSLNEQLSTYDTGSSFKIQWTLNNSVNKTTNIIDGDVRFEPYGNQTLMVYRNFIDSNRALASAGKSQARAAIIDTAVKVVSYIEDLKAKDPKGLQDNQVKTLRDALSTVGK